LYFWNQREKENGGIYIGLGFAKVSKIINFGIFKNHFQFKNNSRKRFPKILKIKGKLLEIY